MDGEPHTNRTEKENNMKHLAILGSIIGVIILMFLLTRVPLGTTVSSTMLLYDTDMLSERASYIVEGTVSNISRTMWSTPDGKKPEKIHVSSITYCDMTVIVTQVYKGEQKNTELLVRMYGGTDSGITFPGNPSKEFKEGDTVLLYLIEDNSIYNAENKSDHMTLVGFEQGAMRVQNGMATNVHGEYSTGMLREKAKKTDTVHDVQTNSSFAH